MAIIDDLKKMGAQPGGDEDKRLTDRVRGAEARKRDFMSEIPAELRKGVDDIARSSHSDFKNRFPDFETFRQAVAECWLKQVEGFRTELFTAGFSPVPPGTKASQLNEQAIALLTESGSFVIVGPGGFDIRGPGAAITYAKIPLRNTSMETPPDITLSDGFVFTATPRKGTAIFPRARQGWTMPFAYTSSVLDWMARPTDVEHALALVQDIKNRIALSFLQAQEETGLAPVKQP